jgi:hypothetical protein
MVAWVLFELDSPAGTVVPAAGAGGTVIVAGCGAGAPGPAGAAPLCFGGLGMYSGPVWPQADSNIRVARAAGSANEDFTIRITV